PQHPPRAVDQQDLGGGRRRLRPGAQQVEAGLVELGRGLVVPVVPGEVLAGGVLEQPVVITDQPQIPLPPHIPKPRILRHHQPRRPTPARPPPYPPSTRYPRSPPHNPPTSAPEYPPTPHAATAPHSPPAHPS